MHAVVSSSQFIVELAPGMDYANETASKGSESVFVAQGSISVTANTFSHIIPGLRGSRRNNLFIQNGKCLYTL